MRCKVKLSSLLFAAYGGQQPGAGILKEVQHRLKSLRAPIIWAGLEWARQANGPVSRPSARVNEGERMPFRAGQPCEPGFHAKPTRGRGWPRRSKATHSLWDLARAFVLVAVRGHQGNLFPCLLQRRCAATV